MTSGRARNTIEAWRLAGAGAIVTLLSMVSYAYVLEFHPAFYEMLRPLAPVLRITAYIGPIAWIGFAIFTFRADWRVGVLHLLLAPIALAGPLIIAMLFTGCALNSANCL